VLSQKELKEMTDAKEREEFIKKKEEEYKLKFANHTMPPNTAILMM